MRRQGLLYQVTHISKLMFKFIIAIVVLLAALGGLWYTGWLSKIIPMIPSMKAAPAAQAPAATTTPVVAKEEPPAPVSDLPTADNDASDQALVQDMAAIDVQIKGLGTDTADSASSINDKQVTQEY